MSNLNKFTYHELPLYIQQIITTIIQGNLESLKTLVQNTQKYNLPIGWWWEPYGNIDSKMTLKCLQYVMDQPNFRFDAVFLGACCYFSPPKLRALVCRHPKAQKWILDPVQFDLDAKQLYYTIQMTSTVGVDQRIYYGKVEIWKHHKRLEKLRASVILYSFFTAYSREFIETYYAPGGKGYLKGKAEFEALAA